MIGIKGMTQTEDIGKGPETSHCWVMWRINQEQTPSYDMEKSDKAKEAKQANQFTAGKWRISALCLSL